MKMVKIVLMAALAALFVSGCVSPQGGKTREWEIDGASMMRARDKVFPALLFIHVVKSNLGSGEKSARTGAGSGFLISEDGYFVTNWHVADKSLELRCLLSDGRSFSADLIGADKDTDLALCKLRLPEGENVPFAVFGSSEKLSECDPVLVMGAPWGMSRSVSTGIISCTRRYLEDASEYMLWLQTDASISPGNSGGPIINADGEVVAITARGSLWGGNLGFGIPADEAQIIVAQLREFGRMNWSWTGIRLQPLHDFERNISFPHTNGVIIADTEQGSPARLAGVLDHDRLLAVNGESVTGFTMENLPEIRRTLGLLPKGDPATLTISRDGGIVEIVMTPREKGDVEGNEMDFPRWDFTAKTINQFDNPELFFRQEKGVFVYGIKYPGNANDSDLSRGDIIKRVGNREIETLGDLKSAHDEAVKNVAAQHRIMFTVLRGGFTRQIVLDFARDYSRR